MSKVYFAHDMNQYGTEQEKRVVEYLESLGFKVINPADLEEEFRATDRSFSFWYRKLEECDMVVFITMLEGFGEYIGKRILAEITHAKETGVQVFQLKNNSLLRVTNIKGKIDLYDDSRYLMVESIFRK